MDKDRFYSLMEDIANAYTDDRLLNDKVIKTWYKYLEEYDIDVLEEAVDGWIKSQQHRPTISDLREQCLRLPEMFPDKYKSAWRAK